MKRAARKNALGNSIDTICGFVRDKNSGPKPFLYLVQNDEAYIGGYTIAIANTATFALLRRYQAADEARRSAAPRLW